MAPSTDWDEIKRLAADFQKAQLSSTSQRLSERNCIEIVSKLIELKLIDVIFTNDGKEYLTSQQLIREIKDEIYVRGGRVNTVELAKELNVDLNQINLNVAEIVKGKEVQLVSGSLITNYYLEKIAREINEKLQLLGQISVGDLTLQYDLPAELLLHSVLEKYLGKLIIGRQDPSDNRIFYTEEYLMRTKAKIRGALMGLLKPTPVSFIISHCNLTERLFMYLFDHINAPGVLTGRQSGSLYVPSCYTKSQNEWVINFYKQNNYLEYDALTRLGISDPKGYIKRILSNEDNTYLSSCVIGAQIKQQLETALEECIASKSYLDVVSLLPSVLSDEDIENVLESMLKSNSKSTMLFDNTVFSNHFIDNLKKSCLPMVQKNVDAVVKSGKYQQFYLEKQMSKSDMQKDSHVDHKAERREERRRKASSGKGGGGTQGRETKTKAVKKHPRSKQAAQDSDSDESSNVVKKSQANLEIVSVQDVEKVIKDALDNEGLEDLTTQIAEYIQGQLNQEALNMAKEMADKLLQDANQNRKQTHSSAQDRINVLVNDIKLYEKGLKLFPSDQQPGFVKYLLKTLGGDVLSEFCKYAANQCNLPIQTDTITVEQRNKILNDVSDEYMKPLKSLNATLSEQTMEQFYQAVDTCLAECGMILKKVDKKKDKLLIQNHREKLISELENCNDPALALHFVVLALFTLLNQNMMHASGRQVPSIIVQLKSQLKDDDFQKLQKFHELVTKYLIAKDEDKEEIEEKLKEDLPEIKNLVQEVKKYK
ncbi:E3 UFM1-protein ligase 1 homolog [Aricia agestis]|uniref:E3 UFM1-protein ligase 1 homolog n=1 Tax=Aricia agestis TaxID=91739 RepID=UPI001C207EE9|nr:E3 UFM1-protein ligase 1 homolog [Aricia agestis]XP_041979699.1 E3 UFM1-protein ligase 1 homolog [Aricia agestis]XP_041979700.1 E3 UFM1-protein ligase 1 homolog [Aricia agestis]